MNWASKAWLKHAGLTQLPNHTVIGEHHKSGDLLHIPDSERETGAYIVGTSGYGKSGLLENMAVQDIAAGDKAVVFIDYDGDTARNIIAATPAEHLHRVSLLDLTDESWPISLNLFTRDNLESSVSVRVAVNRILHLFNALWPETQNHRHLPNFVRASVMTLLANDDTTLYDMYRMFTEPGYRQKLVANVPWENIKNYWREYDGLSKSDKDERGDAVINRLHALFMGDPLMANVLGQAPGRLDFKQVIANKEVIVIKLAGRTMEYESRLVGGTLLAQLQAAVFSGGEPEKRQPVSVFVDEFHTIATPDIKTFFTEGRRHRIALTIAHQIRSQVSKELQDAAVAAKTVVCFRTQLDDSRELAPLFSMGGSIIKPEDVERRACQRLMDDGSPEPIVQAFVDYYLRPLSEHRYGNQIRITTPGYSLRDEFLELANDPKKPAPLPKAPDPISWLDDLFRRCMENRSAAFPIPVEAVAGFANTGPGFWPQVRRMKEDDPILQPYYRFGDEYVVRTAAGEAWAKHIASGRDQLLHCVFAIRWVMDYLAQFPIGTESQTSDKEMSQILRSLPKRACAVRTGDEQGVVFTLDNPPHVSGHELDALIAAILGRTHGLYCRPRSEVEAERQPVTLKPAEATPKSRWEQR